MIILMMNVQINKQHFQKNVIDPVGKFWAKELKKVYKADFDKKSLGGIGMSGVQWPALKQTTIRQKRKLGSRYATRILRRWSTLRNNIDTRYSRGQREIIVFVSDVKVPYAKYHDEGGVHLPKRQILDDLSEKYVEEIKDDIRDTTRNYINDIFLQLRSKNIKVTGFTY